MVASLGRGAPNTVKEFVFTSLEGRIDVVMPSIGTEVDHSGKACEGCAEGSIGLSTTEDTLDAPSDQDDDQLVQQLEAGRVDIVKRSPVEYDQLGMLFAQHGATKQLQ